MNRKCAIKPESYTENIWFVLFDVRSRPYNAYQAYIIALLWIQAPPPIDINSFIFSTFLYCGQFELDLYAADRNKTKLFIAYIKWYRSNIGIVAILTITCQSPTILSTSKLYYICIIKTAHAKILPQITYSRSNCRSVASSYENECDSPWPLLDAFDVLSAAKGRWRFGTYPIERRKCRPLSKLSAWWTSGLLNASPTTTTIMATNIERKQKAHTHTRARAQTHSNQ